MNGELVQAVLLSLLPCAFWLWYVASSSPRRPRKGLLSVALLAGALSTQLVLGLGWVFDQANPRWNEIPMSFAGQLFFFVVNVGLVEEFAKLLAVRLTVYQSRDFQEPWDGLMYSSAAALGFATAENVKYVLGFGDPGVLLGRSLLSTFGHVLMSACWGYNLGLAKGRPNARLLTLQGLAWAALGHGLFDFWLMQGHQLVAVGVLAGLFFLFRLRTTESVLASRHRMVLAHVVRECPACRALSRVPGVWCTACGKPMPDELTQHCEKCLARWDDPGRPCPGCGALTR